METMTSHLLVDRWENAKTEAYVMVGGGPLDWWIGFDQHHRRTLLLVVDQKPQTIPSSKSVGVTTGHRKDNRWAVTFTLLRDEHNDVFVCLCADLIEASRNCVEDTEAVDFVLARYGQWLKLMEHQPSGMLSEPRKRGLLGELWFLQSLLASGVAGEEAVAGWVGPDGADQDFMFPFGWYEVKAVGASGSRVAISSLEQLDAGPSGTLVVVFVDPSAPDEPNSATLNGRIEDIRKALRPSPTALAAYESKLLSYGYVALPDYDNDWYRVSGVRRYSVEEGFPRITRSSVAAEVVSAEYSLSLHALEAWRVNGG